jgi:hypothetical protein
MNSDTLAAQAHSATELPIGIPAPATPAPPAETTPERRKSTDRRAASDRRSSLDRRRGPGRRRTDYRRDAEEGHMNEEQLQFLMAMEEYKSANGCPFPTWTEVLDVALYLGYRKVAPVGDHKLCARKPEND